MKPWQPIRNPFFLVSLIASLLVTAGARGGLAASKREAQKSAAERDGQHDFDFELGTWKIHLKRLVHPLTGSTTWVEFDGDTFTRKVWDGRAQLEQFEVDSPTGHIEGLTLRLYNPQTRQWSLHWANSKDGVMSGPPNIGEFKNGRGEFYAPDTLDGRSILVRYVWSGVTPTSAHFEQSFSDDGGKTWEVNWITDQTRVNSETRWADSDQARPEAPKPGADPGGQHDFDFEFGSWTAHLKRLVHPLTGSNTWVELEGPSIVRKVWDGRANFGELQVGNATTRIEGLSLRLYNPQSHQWSIYWANSRDGSLGLPMIGHFADGRGEFFDQEPFNGKAIFVRFIFSDITANFFRLEQAFSADGGKTWEPNWITTFTRGQQ